MKKKEVKHSIRHVRDHLLPQKSAKKPEKIHEIQPGIAQNHLESCEFQEIPKKSWWVWYDMKQKCQSFICKKCGKGFKSPQAVFGHMRSHSRRKCEIHHHLNVVDVKKCKIPRKKRSVGRYKIKKSCCSNNSSWCSLNNVSSSVTTITTTTTTTATATATDVVDEELKDIVCSLLMLANGGFYAVDHVPDNDDDSVNIEHSFLCDAAVNVAKEFGSNVNSCYDNCVNERDFVVQSGLKFDVLGSGYDSFQEKSKEFDCFDDGVLRTKVKNSEYEPAPDVDLQSEFYGADIKDGAVGTGKVDTMLCGLSSEETKFGDIDVVDRMVDRLKLRTCGSTLVANRDYVETEPTVNVEHESDAGIMNETRGVFQEDAVRKSLIPKNCSPLVEIRKYEKLDSGTTAPNIDNSCLNQSHEYICKICSKSFSSPQALGGHRLHCPHYKRSRGRPKARITTDITLDEESGCRSVELQGVKDETNIFDSSKKRWRHKCMVCCRTFPNGQALGGHMRAHYNGNVQSHKIDKDASDKVIFAAIDEYRNEENDAYGAKIPAAVMKERKKEYDGCSNEIQQLFKEKESIIKPQGNNPLLV